MPDTLRLLIVEDSPDDLELALRELRRSGREVSFKVVETEDDFVASLTQGEWDAIICDHNLPAFDSIRALQALQEQGRDIPFIIVSGVIGEEVAVAAMKAGAADYVRKGNLARLAPALDREVREAAIRREKRQAEEELARTWEWARLALNAGKIGYWEWNALAGEVFWSETLQAIYGLAGAKRTFDDFYERVHPDDRSSVLGVLKRSQQDGQEFIVEYRSVSPDGITRWVESRGLPRYDQAGGFLGMTGVCMDISARKQGEEQLRRRAKQQAAVAQFAQKALEDTPLSALLVEAARTVADTLQVEFGEALELLPGGERLTLRAGVGWRPGHVGQTIIGARLESQAGYTLMANGPVVMTDARTETRFKTPRFLEQHGVVSGITTVIPLDGGPFGVLGAHSVSQQQFTSDDVTFLRSIAHVLSAAIARRQAETELKAEKEKLRMLIEATPAGVLMVDKDARIVAQNRALVDLLGDPEAEGVVFRRADGMPLPPEQLPLRRALQRGETVRAEEIRLERADGRSIPVLVTAMPLWDAGEEPRGAIAVMQDITAREELDRLRSEFIGLVSHEFRTPLTVIKGAANMTQGSNQPMSGEEAAALFELIDRQTDRLTELVENLRDITQIEAGVFGVEPEPIDLAEVIRQTLASLAVGGFTQKVEVQTLGVLPPTIADPQRVSQVFSNLLHNAARFSPPDAPVRIEIEFDEAKAIVRVRDFGRGIPKDKLPYLFRKFSQIHNEGSRKLSGTGLGLAICKGIVEAHGGWIWAESEGEGKGAVFCFTLPLLNLD